MGFRRIGILQWQVLKEHLQQLPLLLKEPKLANSPDCCLPGVDLIHAFRVRLLDYLPCHLFHRLAHALELVQLGLRCEIPEPVEHILPNGQVASAGDGLVDLAD